MLKPRRLVRIIPRVRAC